MEKQLYKPFKSSAKNKKFSVYVMKDGKKRIIHFGSSLHEDFRQHKDPVRRKAYLARAKGLKDTANYWAVHYLWNG